MPKHKSLLISSEIVTAGRKRRCYHNQKHVIVKGDLCLEIRQNMSKKGYCSACAGKMIDDAHALLDGLAVDLVG